MKKKIIIVGKKGLVGSNLNLYLKKKQHVTNLDFDDLIKKKNNFINKFDYIINCASNSKYVKSKYQKKNDFDLKIANKIKDLNINMVMLSSRKVYKTGVNLKESSTLKPKNNYSKNKIISEKALFRILKKRVLILRISNLVGLNKNKSKKLHKTFIDIFYENIKKGLIFDHNNEFKDFLSIDKFCEIINRLIVSNAFGTFNVSIGKKIFLKEILSWLNFHNKKSLKWVKINKLNKADNFTLNNNKLMNKISTKNSAKDLKIFCVKLSKVLFKNNNIKK